MWQLRKPSETPGHPARSVWIVRDSSMVHKTISIALWSIMWCRLTTDTLRVFRHTHTSPHQHHTVSCMPFTPGALTICSRITQSQSNYTACIVLTHTYTHVHTRMYACSHQWSCDSYQRATYPFSLRKTLRLPSVSVSVKTVGMHKLKNKALIGWVYRTGVAMATKCWLIIGWPPLHKQDWSTERMEWGLGLNRPHHLLTPDTCPIYCMDVRCLVT